MEKFRFEINPVESVIEEATRYVSSYLPSYFYLNQLIEKLNFNRTEEDLPIWMGGHDEFFFIVAFERGWEQEKEQNGVGLTQSGQGVVKMGIQKHRQKVVLSVAARDKRKRVIYRIISFNQNDFFSYLFGSN